MVVATVVMASCSKESAPSGSSGAQPNDRTSRAAVGPGDLESDAIEVEAPPTPERMPDDALRGGATIDIVVRGPDDVWIAGGAVVRTQPVGAPVVLPGLAAQWAER